MKIGLYFGSFNPIHVGHLIIANQLVENSDLDKIWFVVTPHNPHKKKSSLLDNYSRLEMVELATKDYETLESCDIEFSLPQPNYTVNTLAHLESKFPANNFSLIMGEDNLKSFHKWKNYQVILEQYQVYVYPRIAEGVVSTEFNNHPKITKVDAPIIGISSTLIRNGIKASKDVRPLLTAEVWKFLDDNLFYK